VSKDIGAGIPTGESVEIEELGNAVGVTFQQIQKYEKGTNANRFRIAATAAAIPEMGSVCNPARPC
jgi:hypothetical protein